MEKKKDIEEEILKNDSDIDNEQEIKEDVIQNVEEATEEKVNEDTEEDKVNEVDKTDNKVEELTDKLKRLMAEFDNYRKRSEKEKTDMFDNGVSLFISKILPIVDNFERGLNSVQEDKKEDAFYQGFEKIYNQLIEALESIGVKSIATEGEKFDPNLHNAVMHDEDEELGENMIVEEFQKGYTYKDKVVRYSMVKVVN